MNVKLVVNHQEFRAIMKAKADAVKQSGKKSSLEAAKFMTFTAKRYAPHSTGDTINGIRYRAKGKGYEVTSSVVGHKGFKQNLFANQTAPFRTIRYTRWNPVYAYPQTVVYGQHAMSRSGKPIKWTARPRGQYQGRFWHWATLDTQTYFGKVARANLKDALRVRV